MSAGLDMLFEKNIGWLSAVLDKSVRAALLEYEHLRETGQRGKLTDIYISFLQSSVLCKLPWLRIDLCDENGRDNPHECFSDLDMSIISKKIYNEADKLKEEKRWTKDYKVQQAWLNAAAKCYLMFEKHFPQIIAECEAAKTTNCKWHFGQFLGNTVVIWEGAEVRNDIF